jgi:hypothetical protein
MCETPGLALVECPQVAQALCLCGVCDRGGFVGVPAAYKTAQAECLCYLTLRQGGASHQVFVNGSCGFAAFGNCPNDERLAAAHVARGKDARN